MHFFGFHISTSGCKSSPTSANPSKRVGQTDRQTDRDRDTDTDTDTGRDSDKEKAIGI